MWRKSTKCPKSRNGIFIQNRFDNAPMYAQFSDEWSWLLNNLKHLKSKMSTAAQISARNEHLSSVGRALKDRLYHN